MAAPPYGKVIHGLDSIFKIVYALHIEKPDGAENPKFKLSALQRIAQACHVAFRIAVLLGTVALRSIKQHPLQWPLSQELIVLLMYGLLNRRQVLAWRQFFLAIARTQAHVQTVQLSEVRTGRCKSWWITLAPHLRPQRPQRVLHWLYFHGGAFVAGHPLMYTEMYAYWMEKLARRGIEVRMLSVDYPLAPEHPFPEGLHAAAEAYQWLAQYCAEEGNTDILIGGDSAGANLLLGGLVHLRDGGQLDPLPQAALLISPAVDVSPSAVFYQVHKEGASSVEEAVASGYYDYIPRESILEGLKLYLQSPGVTMADPRVSPTHLDDLTGLVGEGGLLVLAGQAEVMRPDIAAFAKKASLAGLKVQYHEEPGEPHCYACLPMPHLKHKSQVIVDYIERVVEGICASGDSSSTMSSSSSNMGSSSRSGSELSLSRNGSGAGTWE